MDRIQEQAQDDCPQDNFSDNETSDLYPGELCHVQLLSCLRVLVFCAGSHVGPFDAATHQLLSWVACLVAQGLELGLEEPKVTAAAKNPRLAELLFVLSSALPFVPLGVLLVVLVTVVQWAGARVHLAHPSVAGRRDALAPSALAG